MTTILAIAVAAQSYPLYTSGDIVAFCGGWNTSWPDGDFEEFLDSELVVTTLEESEPWIGVFQFEGRYRVMQRIS